MAQGEWRENIKVEGALLVEEAKRLIHEGNVTHLIVKHEGHTLLEVPVIGGVAMAVLAPTFAALAAVGALVAHCTIEVVRTSA
jgi:hypothetical protein